MGSGLGKPGGEVRWGVAGRMVVAWLVTLPLAGLVGAITYEIVHQIGGYPGAIVGFGLLVAASAAIYIRSRKTKVDHNNVNAEWEGSVTAGLDDEGNPPSATAGIGSGAGPPDISSIDRTTGAGTASTVNGPVTRALDLSAKGWS